MKNSLFSALASAIFPEASNLKRSRPKRPADVELRQQTDHRISPSRNVPKRGNIRRALKAEAQRRCFLNIRKDRLLTGYREKDGSKYRVRFEVSR